jgi:hypothetical protein
MAKIDHPWPALPYGEWSETATTLQLWMQVVGKIRLALTPWLNHSWHVPFYVTAQGLGTSTIYTGVECFDMEFDFVEHRLVLRTSWGIRRELPLIPMTVANFHAQVMTMLQDCGITVQIDPHPCEISGAIPFHEDQVHASYDPDAAHRFWRVLARANQLLSVFRSGFIGKASPVHFFWGSFDLAVTRFSGRTAKLHPGGVPGLSDAVVREAYSHEVSSCGFWPGNPAFPEAAFYAYAYPEPAGFRTGKVSQPASYNEQLGEFILTYDSVRRAADPDQTVMQFLADTYASAADAGGWDRAALECPFGELRKPRNIASI